MHSNYTIEYDLSNCDTLEFLHEETFGNDKVRFETRLNELKRLGYKDKDNFYDYIDGIVNRRQLKYYIKAD